VGDRDNSVSFGKEDVRFSTPRPLPWFSKGEGQRNAQFTYSQTVLTGDIGCDFREQLNS
jgi:hypothetical protein